MQYALLFFLALVGLACTQQPAVTQNVTPVTPDVTPPPEPPASLCAPRADVVSLLVHEHKERPAGFGLAANGAVFERWQGPNSWTLLVNIPMEGGKIQTCFIAAGERWHVATPPVTGERS